MGSECVLCGCKGQIKIDVINLKGKMSTFGGLLDKGMSDSEGLALYEHHEANKRPDLFKPIIKGYEKIPVWKRLKVDSMYCAIRFDPKILRYDLQTTPVKIVNAEGQFVMANLVDWGPHRKTDRVIDVSPGVEAALRLKTDDVVEVVIALA